MEEDTVEGDATKESVDSRKMRPPNRKKYDEEMDAIQQQIREKEKELRSLNEKRPGDVKAMRAEKETAIEARRKLDTDLRAINKEISEKMGQLTRIQSTLHYKTEERINDAIRRLENNLKVQNFKLSEEKKIVAEIDSLKRSKKSLTQYLALKQEIDKKRDLQRRMREDRDYYFKVVNSLKGREDEMKRSNTNVKARVESTKIEIDALYEEKRRMVVEYKKQREDFSEAKQKQRQESLKKREEERKQQQQAHRKERQELAAMKEPFEDEQQLCSTLMTYLQRFNNQPDPPDPPALHRSLDESALSSLQQAASAPARELDDGNLVLLRKSEDSEYFGAGRRPSKSRRKSRKQSMTKLITHTPQVIAQFASLNLRAPSCLSEVMASMEQINARKEFYRQEAKALQALQEGLGVEDLAAALSLGNHSGDSLSMLSDHLEIPEELSQSDAGVSTTESLAAEMSRQPSKTESCESTTDTRPGDQVMEELLRMSQEACEQELSTPLLSLDSDDPHDTTEDMDDVKLCDNQSDSSDTLRSESTAEGNGDSQSRSHFGASRLEDFEGCGGVENDGAPAEVAPLLVSNCLDDREVKECVEREELGLANAAGCDGVCEEQSLAKMDDCVAVSNKSCGREDEEKRTSSRDGETVVDHNCNHEVDEREVRTCGETAESSDSKKIPSDRPAMTQSTKESLADSRYIVEPRVNPARFAGETPVSNCDMDDDKLCYSAPKVMESFEGNREPDIQDTHL